MGRVGIEDEGRVHSVDGLRMPSVTVLGRMKLYLGGVLW